MSGLNITKIVPGTLSEVRPRVEAALKEQGFGILTAIDVQATLKQKIGEDFRPFVILGACNPKLAHRALSTTPDVGGLLPCNVTLDQSDAAQVTVRAFDPAAGLGILGEPALDEVGAEARQRIAAALDAL